MSRKSSRLIVATLVVLGLGSSVADARKRPDLVPVAQIPEPVPFLDGSLTPDTRFSIAATNTTVLGSYSFDIGGVCSPQGWTVVDNTAQIGSFWHVDDFAGVNVNPGDAYAPLAGAKSLWCGTRPGPPGPTCHYVTLPGYGDSWNQTWQTKTCILVSGNLDVSFLMQVDCEENYDAVLLEYTTECDDPSPISDWAFLAGGLGVWDGQLTLSHVASYAVAGNPVKVRLRFESDPGWSDEDGEIDSHAGPVVIDDLFVEGTLEDFEGEAVGAIESDNWESVPIPGYGASYLALFHGSQQVQRFDCFKNMSCLWAATLGSTETYACGGYPQQAAVPRGNWEGQYLDAEIRSPLLPLSGIGNRVGMRVSVYSDQALEFQVFYRWGVSNIVNGCQGPWLDNQYIYFVPSTNWDTFDIRLGGFVNFANASHIRVKLGVIDMAGVWGGMYAGCRSNAPLMDNISVYRVDTVGPEFSIQDGQMFQDTFPVNGSDTGIGRADMAQSLTSNWTPTVQPGDSASFACFDGFTKSGSNPSGLADDLSLGGKQCYIWVHVIDSGVPSATKAGAALTDDPVQYPFKDTQLADGKTWTRIRCDISQAAFAKFRIDLNDNLFEAGDVVEFFFSGTTTAGETSYCSGPHLRFVQSDVELAAESPSEFTILPLDDPTEILYVDGVDVWVVEQAYWDTAFEQLGLSGVHRYDVRGYNEKNSLTTRVTNVAAQLNANYRAILFDFSEKHDRPTYGPPGYYPDDYAMMNEFLAGLTAPGGVYLGGEYVPSNVTSASAASATLFKSTYLPFTLTTDNHRPAYGASPVGTGVGGPFVGDTFVIHGGCHIYKRFDVMAPTGSTTMQVAYGSPAATNGAVINNISGNARVTLSGFGFNYVRDDDEDGVMDRALHLQHILCSLGLCPDSPTDTPAPTASVNRLDQNYPNPFNPQTTIAFSIEKRGRVRLFVYDVAGRLVKTLLDETRAAGSHTDVRWDGTNDARQPVASGVYFCRLVTDGFHQTRKMVLVQ